MNVHITHDTPKIFKQTNYFNFSSANKHNLTAEYKSIKKENKQIFLTMNFECVTISNSRSSCGTDKLFRISFLRKFYLEIEIKENW